ncbi:methionyl-tRNA formyltransferase [Arthrobacter antibioticus]|uniref:methionyl-tRNA formyltransferase n=1 Tax=Arthrobacter sp. H35-MC1 TaxID=3046203 RepID=UPI0024BAA211|nr:methionyl-tRNA formyltransferase [Arthrobacter sp. H35-MC1]MDJ0318075.1 methionyl-tRNA formyltransferase [Arthrobacter sp. H35-MC1]
MRVLFAGTPAVALPSLEALRSAGHEIVAVLTRPDAPLGRKRVMTPSAVASRAAELGLPVIKADKIDAEAAAAIAATAPEVAAIVAYGALIPEHALVIPVHGWINLHFSLLPAWRGAAPVQHSVINGDEVTGASTFLLEKGLDTGPIYGAMTEAIKPTDTSAALLERLSHSGAMLLAQTMDGIAAGVLCGVEQQGEISLAPKLTLEDGHVVWGDPALAISRRIRGVTTEPGAWTMMSGQRFKVGPVLLCPEVTDLTPAQLRIEAKCVLVGTGSHAVELVDVQPAGKKLMKATDWARGLANKEDVVFE